MGGGGGAPGRPGYRSCIKHWGNFRGFSDRVSELSGRGLGDVARAGGWVRGVGGEGKARSNGNWKISNQTSGTRQVCACVNYENMRLRMCSDSTVCSRFTLTLPTVRLSGKSRRNAKLAFSNV